MKLFIHLLRVVFYGSVFVLVLGIFCSLAISDYTGKFTFSNIELLPKCHTALVPGTARQLHNGIENPYFIYRMDAAEKLFKAGKVSALILSGDNRVDDYNEPKVMKIELLKRGIPDSCMVLDYAGLRTFDSMVRCREIFGQDSVIVVSQEFQNARAVYIGRKNGLVAFGFNAQNVSGQQSVKTRLREFFSRIKCILDIYVLNTKPKHLGDRIKIS